MNEDNRSESGLPDRMLTRSGCGGNSTGESTRTLLAADRATFLFRQFPNRENRDAALWIAGVAGILSEYSEEIILGVTDPRGGMWSIQKWLPEGAEIREECERRAVAAAGRSKSDRAIAETLLRRAQDRAETPRNRRETIDELRARYGPNWGLSVGDDRTWEEKRDAAIQSLMSATGKTREQIEADLAKTPDRPGFKPEESARGVVRSEGRPGRRANVLVWTDAPQYAACVEKAKTADPAEWRWDDHARGIWVSLVWLQGPSPLSAALARIAEKAHAAMGTPKS